MQTYRPEIFQVTNLEDAKRIILTPELGMPTEDRWARETPYLVDLIGEHLQPAEADVLLDYGCGVGRIAKGIIEKYSCRVIGVDISDTMRQLAPAYVESDRFSVVSPSILDELVSGGMRFAGACAIWAIQHCPRPEEDVALLSRSLAPGGRLLIVNNRRRAVPTDRGWIDDGGDDEQLIDRYLTPEAALDLDPGAIGPELAGVVFGKTWIRPAGEAKGAPAAGGAAPVDEARRAAGRVQRAYDAFNAGRYGQALELSTTALRDNPRDGEGLLINGTSRAALGQTAAALALLQGASRARGHDAQVWRHLGALSARADEPASAVEAYQRALAVTPDPDKVIGECAGGIYRCDDPQAALPVVERALAGAPDDPALNLLAAKTLHDLRHLEEAEPYFQKALAARPDDPHYRWEYAMQLLLRGRFEKGWEYYHSRVAAHGFGVSQYPFPLTPWTGQPLAGRTLLVHGEQGLGDEIMFYSIVPELIEEAERVIVACSPALAGLVRHSFPGAVVRSFARDTASVAAWKGGAPPPPWTAELAPIDYHCPAGSLPRYRRRSMDDFADPVPYLKAPPGLSARFERLLRERIDRCDATLKVGLAWMGNLATGRMGRHKSIPIERLDEWGALPGVRFVGLHTPEHAVSAARAPGLRLVDLSGHLQSLGHTAALMDNLDLVISVDTVTAHLAGALGRETWVPLRRRADWRYLDVGARGIWYPAMRLFRQASDGDWEPVLAALHDALSARV